MFNLRTDIDKPPHDPRSYQYFQLSSNNLQVLIVHDPTTIKAAASMNVSVGHWSDPKEIPGVAHFCEHMLFMGTEKYPDENYFSAYLSEHGGSSNAYTQNEDTNYYFDISVSNFKHALDIFSRFFIDPLMTESSTERELIAVDNENSNCLLNDSWRYTQLRNSASNPNHPNYKFGTGNRKTLSSPDTRKALLDFHDDHYVASNMSLCILSNDSIETMCQWVVELFSAVKSGTDKAPIKFYGDNGNRIIPLAFGSNEVQKLYRMVPVKDFRVMRLLFPMPSSVPEYLKKPARYLSHLIGHEGKGSIFYALQQKGWATALVAGEMVSNTDFDLFGIDISLTQEGQDNIDSIVSLVFSYIKLVEDSCIPEWIFQECKKISHLDFRFKEATEPYKYVCHLSSMMSRSCGVKVEHLLSGPYLFEQFDRERILSLAKLINPNNMIMFICSQIFKEKTDHVEPWYGTEYSVSAFSQENFEAWKPNPLPDCEPLHLPAINQFIPTNFNILGDKAVKPSLPVLIRDDALCKLWFKQDDTFMQPKGAIRFVIITPWASKSPLSILLSQLFSLILQEDLSEITYNATVAGIDTKLEAQHEGITVYLQGYTSSLLEVAKIVFNELGNFTLDINSPERIRIFEYLKEKLWRQYKNYSRSAAYQVAQYQFQSCTNNRFTIKQRIAVFDQLTPQSLFNFTKEVFQKCFFKGFVHGNLSKTDALNLARDLEEILHPTPLTSAEIPVSQVVKIPKAENEFYTVDTEHEDPLSTNSAIYYFFQVAESDEVLDAKMNLLSHIVDEPAFDVLRTKQQLGYLVWTSNRYVYGTRGLSFTIQSNSRDPVYLQHRILDFLREFCNTLKDMTDTQFNANVTGLITILEEKDRELFAETERHWNEIMNRACCFDRVTREIEILKTLTKEDILCLLNQTLQSAQLVIRVYRYNSKSQDQTIEANERVIENIEQWKSEREFYPNPPRSVKATL